MAAQARGRSAYAGSGPLGRVPVFYGWVLVATAFVTMGIVVNARTAFSLFFPAIYDHTGSYAPAFWIAIACSAVSIAAMWLAAPRKVRLVAGRVPR